MLWIIGGIFLLVICLLIYLLTRGADVKKDNGYLHSVEDEEQEKAIRKINQKASM